MASVDRRAFIRRLVVGGVSFSVVNTLDPDFWSWVPGQKTICIPEIVAPAGIDLVQVLGYQVLRFGAQECVVARGYEDEIVSANYPGPGGVFRIGPEVIGSIERIPVTGFLDGEAAIELPGRRLRVVDPTDPQNMILGIRVRDGRFVSLRSVDTDLQQQPAYPRSLRQATPLDSDARIKSPALRLGRRMIPV